MRNLKRALSLAMATFMLLGMMVVSAGAVSISDFSDGEKIVNQEAVTVLTTLGVIAGRDDGSYDPEGTVTRGEMAKMICVILNGGRDPQLGETIKNSYTDTVGHWAASYIEYCTTLGIISGKGANTFDPDGNVTVAEAGKMILVALGYNAGVEGYVGANWQINTDVRANALGLYDELGTLNTNVALTRDNAAQICYNALDEKMVEYSYIITGTQDNSISTKPQLNDSKKGTLLYDKFGAVKVKGVVVSNEFAVLDSKKTDPEKSKTVIGSSLDAGKSEVLITNHGEEQGVFTNKNTTFTVVTGEAELGKTVWMFVKPGTTSLKSTVIGSAIISDENTIVEDAGGKKASEVADDNNLDVTVDTQYIYNYATMHKLAKDEKPAYDGMVGVQKTIVDTDSDGDVDYVLYKEMGLGKVITYTEAKDGQIVVNVNDGNLINKNKNNIVGFEDVAKDNYVLTAYIGGRLYVQVAESVTGKIDAYKQTGTSPNFRTTGFTIDGETYTVSRVKSVAGDLAVATDNVDKTIIASEATFYQDLSGNVIAYGEVDQSAYKFAYIWGAEPGSKIGDDLVKATLEDGTEKTFTLNDNSDVDVAKAGDPGIDDRTVVVDTNMQGRVYAYTLTSSGEIKLYFPKGGAVDQADPIFTNSLTNIRFAGDAPGTTFPPLAHKAGDPAVRLADTYYSNNATTFFYVTMKDATTVKSVDVYNGRNKAPSIDGTAGDARLALRNANGDVGAAVFTDVKVTASAGDHMFIYNANYVWDEYGYVDAYLNGETEPQTNVKVALMENGEIEHNPLVVDGVYLFKATSKGYYEITKPTSSIPYYFEGYIRSVNKATNTFVIVDKNGDFKTEVRMDDKSVVVDYDSDDGAPLAATSFSVAARDKVQVIVNNDKDRKALMVGIMDRMADDVITKPGENTDFNIGDAVTLSSLAKVANVHAEFAKGNNVIIPSNWTADANLTIPADRALKIEGNMGFAGNMVVMNYGTLKVTDTLTTDAAQTSIDGEVVVKNLTLAADLTVNANITATNDVVSNNNDVTVSKGKSLMVGNDINLGTGDLTNYGHTEWGKDLIADNSSDFSDSSLVGKKMILTGIFTVGNANNPGRYNIGDVVANEIVLANPTTDSIITGTLEPKSGSTITVSGASNVTLEVRGGIVGGVTSTDVRVESPKVDGDLVLEGSASASVGSADSITNNGTGTAETTDPKAEVTLKPGQDGYTVSGTYAGDVTLSAGTITAGTTLTFNGGLTIASNVIVAGTLVINGEVGGLDNLTGSTVGEDSTPIGTVKFGGKATVTEGSTSAKFVEKNTATAEVLKSRTFAWNGTAFAANTSNVAAVTVGIAIVDDFNNLPEWIPADWFNADQKGVENAFRAHPNLFIKVDAATGVDLADADWSNLKVYKDGKEVKLVLADDASVEVQTVVAKKLFGLTIVEPWLNTDTDGDHTGAQDHLDRTATAETLKKVTAGEYKVSFTINGETVTSDVVNYAGSAGPVYPTPDPEPTTP